MLSRIIHIVSKKRVDCKWWFINESKSTQVNTGVYFRVEELKSLVRIIKQQTKVYCELIVKSFVINLPFKQIFVNFILFKVPFTKE